MTYLIFTLLALVGLLVMLYSQPISRVGALGFATVAVVISTQGLYALGVERQLQANPTNGTPTPCTMQSSCCKPEASTS